MNRPARQESCGGPCVSKYPWMLLLASGAKGTNVPGPSEPLSSKAGGEFVGLLCKAAFLVRTPNGQLANPIQFADAMPLRTLLFLPHKIQLPAEI